MGISEHINAEAWNRAGRFAVLFPGQGSQCVGMGADEINKCSGYGRLIEQASELTGTDLESLRKYGPANKLQSTALIEPLLTAISLAQFQNILESGMTPGIVAGHSLGEIAALAAVGVISNQDAITIAAIRGELMQRTARRHNGGMIAIMFVPRLNIDELLINKRYKGKVFLSNDNSPDQIVVSGENIDIKSFAADVISMYPYGKVCRVAVDGPWHSPLLMPEQDEFSQQIKAIKFHDAAIPVILNRTGKAETRAERIKIPLIEQMTHTVLWRQSMKTCRQSEFEDIVIMEPSRILISLARANGYRKIDMRLSGDVRMPGKQTSAEKITEVLL